MSFSTYHVFFRNLANPLKVKIVSALKSGSMNVGELGDELKVEQSKLSHALATLKSCNIVECRQEGKQRIYSLNKKTIVPLLNLVDKHAQNFCDCKCCANKSCGRVISRDKISGTKSKSPSEVRRGRK
jgi:DNA-binding transcriptional ArsR family regulator